MPHTKGSFYTTVGNHLQQGACTYSVSRPDRHNATVNIRRSQEGSKNKQSGDNTARCLACLQEAKGNSERDLWKPVQKCHLHGAFLLAFVLSVLLWT